MSSLFAKIFQQTEKTFSSSNKDSIISNLALLKKLVDLIDKSEDLEINSHFVSKRAFQQTDKAPCTFVNICEKDRFTLSVFILNASYTMPLHDHPKMVGILKVISGKLKIQSYTRIPNSDDELLVTSNPPLILDRHSPASFLDEKNCNYHEITALDGPAAFFDILSPPYSDFGDLTPESRHCHFYRKLMVDNSKDRKILKLEKIECPSHYFCDSLQFDKPEFLS